MYPSRPNDETRRALRAAGSVRDAATVPPVMTDPTDSGDARTEPTDSVTQPNGTPADQGGPAEVSAASAGASGPGEPSSPTEPTGTPAHEGETLGPAAEPSPEDFGGEFERVTASRRWPVVVVALLAVIALLASMFLVRSASSGTGEGDGGDRQATPTTEPPEPATEAEIDAAVAEISEFVAVEAGLDFLAPVTVELEGEGAFQQRLLADFDEDADELRKTEVILTALGLVDPDLDLVESMRSLLGGGVVGFYDTETDELVVRGAALTPYVRTTIAHELTHALDDQHHDLHRPAYDDAADEVSFGFSAVVEGNARRIEGAYLASLDEDERRQAAEEELALGGGVNLDRTPLILVDLIGAPYTLGEPFVDAVVADGGDAALAAAFADPPRTSEQVFDPDRFLAGEEAIDVPVPQVPGEVVDEGSLGQLLVLLVLADELGIETARIAATGWGGDWGVVWRDGDRSCVTANLVGDDVGETEEMRQAFERWAEAHEGAQVVPTGAGGPFTVESCAG